ncbi:MAG: VOC family protein [Acidimicrobiia bacterium]|nr:VOC family protein [Acidimicrobiia bacterium]
MPYVGYVEFNVPDEGQTAQFYKAVFGWEASEMYPGYLSVTSGDEPGIDTGIARSEDGSVSTVATLLVEDLDAAMAKVEEHGGTVTVPRFPIPGVGSACYFTDINDMTVGLWEADSSAG